MNEEIFRRELLSFLLNIQWPPNFTVADVQNLAARAVADYREIYQARMKTVVLKDGESYHNRDGVRTRIINEKQVELREVIRKEPQGYQHD